MSFPVLCNLAVLGDRAYRCGRLKDEVARRVHSRCDAIFNYRGFTSAIRSFVLNCGAPKMDRQRLGNSVEGAYNLRDFLTRACPNGLEVYVSRAQCNAVARHVFLAYGVVSDRFHLARNNVYRRESSIRVATCVSAKSEELRVFVCFSTSTFHPFRVRVFRSRAFYRQAATCARRWLVDYGDSYSVYVFM